MRARPLVLLLLGLAGIGCQSPRGTAVLVEVDTAIPLPDVARLSAHAAAGGRARDFDVPLAIHSIPPTHTFTVEVPDSITGTFTIELEAFDSLGHSLARASGATDLAPGERRDVVVRFGDPGSGGPDLGAGSDLTGAPLLTSLVVSPGTLAPPFSPTVTDYSVAVPLSVQAVTVTATASPEASITVGGAGVASGSPSNPIALALGKTTIPVVVTSPSGSVTYTVAVTRGGSVDFLKSSNPRPSDRFGYAIAFDGDTLAVGALGESSSTTGVDSTPDQNASGSGAVYVFVRSGSTWSQQAYLKPSNTGAGDGFGASVALSGDTLAVGAPYEDSGTKGIGTTPDEAAADSGATYVFVRSGSTWSQQAYVKASDTAAGAQFGATVALSGDTLAVGTVAGVAVHVFARTGSTWSQQAYLQSPSGSTSDYFGSCVALSGDTLAVGAPAESSSTTGIDSTPNENAPDSGAAYVFVRTGATWSLQAYVKPSNTGAGDRFGSTVALSHDTLAVDAWFEDSGTTGVNSTPDESLRDSGAVYVFVRAGSVWSQQAYIKSSNPDTLDEFGYSLAVDGDTLAVGAIFEDSGTTGINSTPTNSLENSGAVYLFTRAGATWSQLAYIKSPAPSAIDTFGRSVALSGGRLAVGVDRDDTGNGGINPPLDDAAEDSGAVYVY